MARGNVISFDKNKELMNDYVNKSKITSDYEKFSAYSGRMLKKLWEEKIIDLEKHDITVTEVETEYEKVRSINIKPFLEYSGESIYTAVVVVEEEENITKEEEEAILIETISYTFNKVSDSLSSIVKKSFEFDYPRLQGGAFRRIHG